MICVYFVKVISITNVSYRICAGPSPPLLEKRVITSTVGINPTLSDPFTPRTSKLGWRYFEANEIDRNKLQIRTN